MKFSVVVPVRNEAENIVPLVNEIRDVLTNIGEPFEILYVNDGSADGTAVQLEAARKTVPELRVLTHAVFQGQSRALITGIRAACGALIVQLDGDGQNDPARIPVLWARYRQETETNRRLMICGWRRSRKDNVWRRFSSRFANGLRARLLGDKTPDSGCGLKLYPREAFMDLPHFDHMHRFLPALFIRRGFTVLSVDVNHRPRAHGHSNYGTWDRLWAGIWDLMGVMWLQRRTRYPEIVEPTASTKDRF